MIKIMNQVYRLMVLNILVILTSIPIITIGAAFAAMFTALKTEDDSVVKAFKEAFLRVIKPSLPITGMFVVLMTGAGLMTASILGILLFLEVWVVFLTCLKLLSLYELDFLPLLKNGFILANHLMGQHLVSLICAYLILKMSCYMPAIGIFIGFALWGMIFNYLFDHGLSKTLRSIGHENV